MATAHGQSPVCGHNSQLKHRLILQPEGARRTVLESDDDLSRHTGSVFKPKTFLGQLNVDTVDAKSLAPVPIDKHVSVMVVYPVAGFASRPVPPVVDGEGSNATALGTRMATVPIVLHHEAVVFWPEEGVRLLPLLLLLRVFGAIHHNERCLQRSDASLKEMGIKNWETGIADHRNIPLKDASVDLVISGWSFCYLAVWGGNAWKAALEDGLSEMKRILKPGGMMILLETQGTGVNEPTPPPHLDGYFAWLAEAGFGSGVFRTDYRFATLTEAEELSIFFFGEEMGKKVVANNWQILPEWTGIFWKMKDNPL